LRELEVRLDSEPGVQVARLGLVAHARVLQLNFRSVFIRRKPMSLPHAELANPGGAPNGSIRRYVDFSSCSSTPSRDARLRTTARDGYSLEPRSCISPVNPADSYSQAGNDLQPSTKGYEWQEYLEI
jgi:hypothetical protein